MRILKEATVGLIIDIQERLFPHIDGNGQLLKNVEILTEGLQILDIPVKITEQYPRGLGTTIQPLKKILGNNQVFEKMSFSCCDEKGFYDYLIEAGQGRKNIIIAGIETHVCVLQTVVDLLSKGFQPVVIYDCVSSRSAIDKEIAIQRIRAEGAFVSTYESILFELARVSGTEDFKKISRLVK